MMKSAGSPAFNILWIEDNPDSMEQQMDEVAAHIAKSGFTPNIVKRLDGNDVLEMVEQQRIDIVVTDNNITEGENGVQVVKSLRDKALLTDILFYSAVSGFDEEEAHNSLSRYGFLDIAKGKRDIATRLKKLVDKNLRRWGDLMLLRGIVISQTIDVEVRINDILERYFSITKEKHDDFHHLILENHFQLEGKVHALRKIIKDNGAQAQKDFAKLLDMLCHIQKMRNYLAHCREDPKNKNHLMYIGDPKPFRRQDFQVIFDETKQISMDLDKLIAKLFPSKKS